MTTPFFNHQPDQTLSNVQPIKLQAFERVDPKSVLRTLWLFNSLLWKTSIAVSDSYDKQRVVLLLLMN